MANQPQMDEKKIKDVEEKLEEVQAILQYLAVEHGLDFCFNYNLTSNGGYKNHIDDIMYSGNISNETLIHFMDRLQQVHSDINVVPNLVKKAKFMVTCVDDTNQPEGVGDWPKANGVYMVDDIISNGPNAGWCYVLRGLKPNKPYNDYNAKRFKMIRVKEWSN